MKENIKLSEIIKKYEEIFEKIKNLSEDDKKDALKFFKKIIKNFFIKIDNESYIYFKIKGEDLNIIYKSKDDIPLNEDELFKLYDKELNINHTTYPLLNELINIYEENIIDKTDDTKIKIIDKSNEIIGKYWDLLNKEGQEETRKYIDSLKNYNSKKELYDKYNEFVDKKHIFQNSIICGTNTGLILLFCIIPIEFISFLLFNLSDKIMKTLIFLTMAEPAIVIPIASIIAASLTSHKREKLKCLCDENNINENSMNQLEEECTKNRINMLHINELIWQLEEANKSLKKMKKRLNKVKKEKGYKLNELYKLRSELTNNENNNELIEEEKTYSKIKW